MILCEILYVWIFFFPLQDIFLLPAQKEHSERVSIVSLSLKAQNYVVQGITLCLSKDRSETFIIIYNVRELK